MRKIKTWLTGIALLIGSLFGYQIQRAPVLEHVPPTSQTSPSPTPAVTTSDSYDVELGTVKNADLKQQEQIKIAIGYMKQVLSSDCFEDRILTGEFTETNGLTNEQILNIVHSRVFTINFEFFYGTRMQNYVYKTMGYDIGDGVVYMNSFYVEDAKTIMSLAMHEALGHGLGFSHRVRGQEYSSFPYKLNEISEACLAVIKGE